MKRKIFSILLTLVLALSLCLVTAVPVAAQTIIHVPGDYGTIQEAIDVAGSGNTISVADGIYEESLVVNTADLTIESVSGQDSTTIQNVGNAGGQQTGFLLMAGATNFTLGGSEGHGFTIEGGTGTAPRLIQLNNAPSGVELSYNTFDSSDTNGTISTGINIGAAGATGLTVSNNIFIADEDDTYQDWPIIGPDTTNPVSDVTVSDNEFTGSGTPDKYGAAICLGKVEGTSTFSGNTISAFDRGIIISAGSSDLDVSGNTISNCGKGIQFRPDTHAEMENNIFANNTYNIYHAAEILTGGSSFYGNIQDAIDAAIAGDTISVAAGTYTEDLTVNIADLTLKSVSGPGSTTIQLTGDVKPGIDIQAGANGFTLGGAEDEGFTILGPAVAAGGSFTIQLTNAPSGVEISYNTINTTGIASQGISVGAAGATDLTISNNAFTAEVGDISIWSPDMVNLTVSDNTFTGPGSTTNGVAVEPAGATGTSTISGNTISGYGTGVWILSGGPNGGTTEVSGLTISDNTISGCAKGITLGHTSVTSDMTTITVTENILSTNTVGIYISDGGSVIASDFVIEYNNISGNTAYGLENAHTTELVTAENNWWGAASGPTHTSNPPGTGDAVSDNVDFTPWLLSEGGEPVVTYTDYIPVPDGWSLISPDRAWADWEALGSDLVLTYDTSIPEPAFVEPQSLSLSPLTAIYVKTIGGGMIGVNYPVDDLGMYATNLEAGWNLIGIPETNATTGAILSPIRYGAGSEIALATLASQGNYNPSGYNFYESMLGEGVPVGVVGLSAFDGYWAYMNVAKEFGVVVVP